MLLYLVVLCLLAVPCSSSSAFRRKRQAFSCSNSGMTDAARLLFLNAHNEARLSVARGLEPNKCGFLGPAKNMYKLQWDCDLEKQAQNAIAVCPSSSGLLSTTAQNIIKYTGTFPDPLVAVAAAVNKWWSTVRQYGSTDPDNKYVNSNLFSFANMVYGKTTAIGCAYKVCSLSNALTVTCMYNKIGYNTNNVMFEKGSPCVSAADCTTYAKSSCSGGLCVNAPEPADTGANTMCPSNENMTDASRKKFLDMHNYLRSRLASGLEPDALGGNAPKASKMLKMVYDCDVEASAIKHSQKCVYEHSLSSDRPGLGENIYMTSALNADRVTTATESSQLWWDELKNNGVGPENNLTQALWNRPEMQIGHYTQMAWDRSYKLGCSIQHCPTFTYSVCQYGPAGNYINQLIYTMGEPCTSDAGCPGSYTCSADEALCNVV